MQMGFPGGSDSQESACNAEDRGSPKGENGYLLQYSCLKNSMDIGSLVGYGAWGRKELNA